VTAVDFSATAVDYGRSLAGADSADVAERIEWAGAISAPEVTRASTPAAGQVQVSVDQSIEVLDPDEWDVVVAEDRPRAAIGTGADAVVRAVRRS
jgi:hypothetical protein